MLTAFAFQSCNSNKPADATKEVKPVEVNKEDTGLTAYYFHANRRCITCEAVEKISKETIAADYNGKVIFKVINREEDSDNPLVKKYEISGQTLLLVKGDEVKDMTSAAFMYAKDSPERFEEKLKVAIESML
jgi:hypothetical protein